MEASEALAGTGVEQPQGDGDAVQEGSGLDSGQNGSGPFDLSHVPEELRPAVAEALKGVEGSITKRFQEAAEYRRQWEPFEGIEGLSDVPPEELGQLVQLRTVMQDDEQFLNWYANAGREMAKQAPEQFEDLFTEIGEDLGYFDDGEPGEEGEAEGNGQLGEEQLKQMLDERLKPFEDRLSAQDQSERVEAEKAKIREQLDGLKEEHGEFDEDAVVRLAHSYGDAEDAITRAHQDYLRLTGQAQSELVDAKDDQPPPATGTGQPDTSPEAPATFDDAKAPALSRMRSG